MVLVSHDVRLCLQVTPSPNPSRREGGITDGRSGASVPRRYHVRRWAWDEPMHKVRA